MEDTALASLPELHGGALLTLDGDVWWLGGERSHKGRVSGVLRHGSEGWEPAGSMAFARVGATATALPDGRFVVIGGYGGETGGARILAE